MYEALPLKEGVYWVGAIDWNIREFHGYTTNRGTTYNAYLVKDEKTVLVDTVKAGFFSEMISRIKSIQDPEKIDYIIVNHVEMDHSGALPLMKELAPRSQIIATDHGSKGLQRHYRHDWEIQKVKTGSELSLGRKTLQFLEAYMLHWPDSMFTYLKEDAILLPNDGFGQHYASFHRFDDEDGQLEIVMEEATKYYANILMPLGPLIPPLLKKVEKMNLAIDMIAPSHGIIWRSHIDRIIESYMRWSQGVAEDKVVIIYDTMWGSTELMARAICEGLSQRGVENKLIDLKKNHYSDVIKDVLTAKALVIGSPTINEGMMPSVAQLLSYLKGLHPLKKKGLAFGSYGWSGEAVEAISKEMKASGIEVLEEGLAVMFVPGEEDLGKCVELGQRVADDLFV
jgi:anaerobic nitric oxide reductase flavorubredoxin